MSAKPFLDTNILIYAFAANDPRSARAVALLADGGVVSVQVLNEFVNVSLKKLQRTWSDIDAALNVLRDLVDPPLPLTMDVHEAAIRLARGGKFAFYDALIVAAASKAKCPVLYSEDMQHARTVGGLTIRNPFVPV